MSIRVLAPAAVLAAAATALLAVTGAVAAPQRATSPAVTAAPAATPSALVQALQATYVQVVKKVAPTVVQIESGSGLGSGIVFDRSGHIVTNAHVVGDATSFKVTFANGRTYTGKLVGAFPANDIAVISIPARPAPAVFADSARVQVGQIAMAVGNPLGLSSSVTEGIISAIGRTGQAGGGISLPNLIQTSAPINPGNSGGALVDIRGRVIGIPTLGASNPAYGGAPASGIGFAIPANDAKRIANQLIQFGKVVNSGRAYLGVRVATITTGGVIVTDLEAGGPAEKAGVRADDVIEQIGGKPTPTVDDLSEVLAGFKPGQKVKVQLVSSAGGQRTVTVTLGELPGS
jgi:S1-C subfamily serine protease